MIDARSLGYPLVLVDRPRALARPRGACGTATHVAGVEDSRVDPLSKTGLDAALAGDAALVRELVAALAPVVHARVGRTLLRRRSRGGSDLRAALEDLVQDTFLALLQDGGKLLRAWNPERGLSLDSFVGLVAEQRVLATLRSRRKSPWSEELAIDDGDLDVTDARSPSPEARAQSREALEDLLERGQGAPVAHGDGAVHGARRP